MHGDVRQRDDVLQVRGVDLVVDCAAEPSVLAGQDDPDYVIATNLGGTVNTLELARREGADVVFLSTSRVYPVDPINGLRFREEETRWVMEEEQPLPGASARGLSEQFPLAGARSLYGASKLASELLLHEYIAAYGLRGIVNRCGVLTGPWQMGKVDQGVIVLWVAKHVYGGRLSYIGYGGSGKQVRDILHVQDLFELLEIQLARLDDLTGETFNVGGGPEISVSLKELTELCRGATGNTIRIDRVTANRPLDVIVFLTDYAKVAAKTGWRPKTHPPEILAQITKWIVDNKRALEPVLA